MILINSPWFKKIKSDQLIQIQLETEPSIGPAKVVRTWNSPTKNRKNKKKRKKTLIILPRPLKFESHLGQLHVQVTC